MIRITVELVPAGEESRRSIIGRAFIYNATPCQHMDENQCECEAQYHWVSDLNMKRMDPSHQLPAGRFVKHQRKDSVWKLIGKVIDAAFARTREGASADVR